MKTSGLKKPYKQFKSSLAEDFWCLSVFQTILEEKFAICTNAT